MSGRSVSVYSGGDSISAVLYYSFGYWPAALAAYNAGEGQVNSALFRYGTIDYWVLSDEEALPEKPLDMCLRF